MIHGGVLSFVMTVYLQLLAERRQLGAEADQVLTSMVKGGIAASHHTGWGDQDE
jgi:hypothetical protein